MRKLGATMAALAIAISAAGCATKRYVLEQVAAMASDVREVELPPEAATLAPAVSVQSEELASARELAELARARATEAEHRARGGFFLEPAFTVDGIRFEPGSARLEREAMALLDQLAERLRLEDKGSYLEVEGHTDSLGGATDNLRLGQRRAEAVRRYLHQAGGLPLHHIAVISFGQEAPTADNGTPEGRASNRRVRVVVLRRP